MHLKRAFRSVQIKPWYPLLNLLQNKLSDRQFERLIDGDTSDPDAEGAEEEEEEEDQDSNEEEEDDDKTISSEEEWEASIKKKRSNGKKKKKKPVSEVRCSFIL